MLSPQVGELYETFVEFEQFPSQGKTRPVVVLHVLDDGRVVAAATITSKNDNPYFSHVKLPILNWRSKITGLTSMSWVNLNNIRIIETKLFGKRLGQMHPLDLQRLFHAIDSL